MDDIGMGNISNDDIPHINSAHIGLLKLSWSNSFDCAERFHVEQVHVSTVVQTTLWC